jgi:hypothetical protein
MKLNKKLQSLIAFSGGRCFRSASQGDPFGASTISLKLPKKPATTRHHLGNGLNMTNNLLFPFHIVNTPKWTKNKFTNIFIIQDFLISYQVISIHGCCTKRMENKNNIYLMELVMQELLSRH